MKRGLICLLFVCLCMCTGCDNDNGTGGGTGGGQPVISSISPDQVSRGQRNAEAVITGSNLTGVTSVNLGDGITTEQFTATNASQINVRFSVAANTSSGPRTITVATSRGTASAPSLLTVINNRVPTARFTASPSIGAKNTTFMFDATSSDDPDGSVAAYSWDFGDGTGDNGRITAHQYPSTGSFEVRLTVRDNDQATSEASKTVEVSEGKAPVARFFITPEEGDINTTFVFNAINSSDADGSIEEHRWNFGDGKTATGVAVEHRFAAAGTFDVVLTVVDNDGLEGSSLKDLKVDSFNSEAAEREILRVITDFFDLYSQLDELTAEQICVGFVKGDPECPGRAREIGIIEQHQTFITKTRARITGDVEIFIHPGNKIANADVPANFQWTETDGSKHESNVLHRFELRFQDGRWQICNFTAENIE